MRRWPAITLLLISTTAAASYRQSVDGWQVFDFVAKEKGVDIIGCMASRPYKDGTRLSFVVTTAYNWAIGVANESWHLKPEASTDVAARVDRRFVASGKAWHLDSKSALLPINGVEPFRALQMGHQLDLQTPYGNSAYTLTGSAKAMSAVLECVQTLTPALPSEASQAPYQIVPQAELVIMLVNVLNSARIVGYNVDRPKPDTGGGISFSLSNGIVGGFRAAQGAATPSPDDYAGAVIRNRSHFCKGDFLSGRQSVPSVDGSVVRKVVTTCRSSSGTEGAETTIIRRMSGLLIEMTFLYPANAHVPAGSDNERATLLDAVLKVTDTR